MKWIRNLFLKTGVVQSIDLTFGGAGNQIMRINDVKYATWIDYRKWPKVGDKVRHRPYRTSDGCGNDIIATKIMERL